MKSIILVCILALTANAYARSETIVGNGGDAVVCKNKSGTITSVELLDYYEGRTIHGIQPHLEGSSFKEMVEFAMQRLRPVSDWRADTYGQWLSTMAAEWKFIPDADLTDIPDSAHIVLPKNCEIKQLAIQRPPMDGSQIRYTVDKDLWDLMDDKNRAGLVMHEFIYREAIFENHENSIATRYFNALVSSDQISQYNWQSFMELLESLKLSYHSIQGFIFHIGDFEMSDNFINFTIGRESHHSAAWGEIHAVKGKAMFALVNGNPILREFSGKYSGRAHLFGQTVDVGGNELKLNQHGGIESIGLAQPVSVNVQGKEILLATEQVSIYPNGNLLTGYLAEPRYLHHMNGTWSTYFGLVTFAENGLVIEGEVFK